MAEVNQECEERGPASVPKGFGTPCKKMGWDTQQMWVQLSDQKTPWFEAPNGAYVYWNQSDGQWWIDAPDGGGVYVAAAPSGLPPAAGWKALAGAASPLPRVEVMADRSMGA
mmetsp:Transcript_25457/g.80311  ORF Transcript_25457/g.80311 Transcript_25457/m.80311 type:complete len:112 (+) Transcript_25457:830-1165(+)